MTDADSKILHEVHRSSIISQITQQSTHVSYLYCCQEDEREKGNSRIKEMMCNKEEEGW